MLGNEKYGTLGGKIMGTGPALVGVVGNFGSEEAPEKVLFELNSNGGKPGRELRVGKKHQAPRS